MRDLGFVSFDFAASEAGAVEATAGRRPDLITADVRLAQGCGIAAVEAICGGQRIAVVFITGTGRDVASDCETPS